MIRHWKGPSREVFKETSDGALCAGCGGRGDARSKVGLDELRGLPQAV